MPVGKDSVPCTCLGPCGHHTEVCRQCPQCLGNPGQCWVCVGTLSLVIGSMPLGHSQGGPPLQMTCMVPREPQALSRLLPSALQLVNRLGSARGGAELCMQSPAVRAREQHRREQLAAVEGECCGAGLGETTSFSNQGVLLGGGAVRAKEGSGWERRGCRGRGARSGSQHPTGAA